MRSSGSAIACPATETMTSPMISPAAAAGLSGLTFTAMTAVRCARCSRCAQRVGQHDGLRADAEVRSRNPAALDHVIDQSADRRGADRALHVTGGARGGDADDASAHVDERSSGEARIEREIDRNDLAGRLAAAADVQGADDAGAGPRSRADGQHQMADAELAVIGNVGGRRALRVGAEHGDVEPRITPGHLGRERPTVGPVSVTSRSASTVWFAVTTSPARHRTPVEGSRGRPCTASTAPDARSTAPASALERSITVVIVVLLS